MDDFDTLKLCAECAWDILKLDENLLTHPITNPAAPLRALPSEIVFSLSQFTLPPIGGTAAATSFTFLIPPSPSPTLQVTSAAPVRISGRPKSVSSHSLRQPQRMQPLPPPRPQSSHLPLAFDIFPSLSSEYLHEKLSSPLDTLCARLIATIWNMFQNSDLLLKDQKYEVLDTLIHVLTIDPTICLYKGLILAQRQVLRVLQVASKNTVPNHVILNLVEVMKHPNLPSIVRIELGEFLVNVIQVSADNFTSFQYYGGHKAIVNSLQFFEEGNTLELVNTYLSHAFPSIHKSLFISQGLQATLLTVVDLIQSIKQVNFEETRTQILSAINILLNLYYVDHHPAFEEFRVHKPIMQLLSLFDALSLENRTMITKIIGVVMEHTSLSAEDLHQYCLLLQGSRASTVVLVSQHLTHIVSSGLVKREDLQNAGLLSILTQDCMVPPNDLKCAFMDEPELQETIYMVPHCDGQLCDFDLVLIHVSNFLLKLAHAFVKNDPGVHILFKDSFSVATLAALLPYSISRTTLLQVLEMLAENPQADLYTKVVQDLLGFLGNSKPDDYDTREGPRLPSFLVRILETAASALKLNPDSQTIFREGLPLLTDALKYCALFSLGAKFHPRVFDSLLNLATHGAWPSCHTQAGEISACFSCCVAVTFDVPEVVAIVMDVMNSSFDNQPNLPSMSLFIESVLEIIQALPENLYLLRTTTLAESIIEHYSSIYEFNGQFETRLAKLFLKLMEVDTSPRLLQSFLTLFGNPMPPSSQLPILERMMSYAPCPDHSVNFSPRCMLYLRGNLTERIWLPHHLSISLWFKISSPMAHSEIIYLVHFEPKEKSSLSNLQLSLTRGTLVLQARAQVSSQPSSARGPVHLDFPDYTFHAGQWYHVVIHLETPVRRKVLNGTANLYVNGFIVTRAYMAVPPQQPTQVTVHFGTGLSGQDTTSNKSLSTCKWQLGPCFCFDKALKPPDVFFMYHLGPNFTSNLLVDIKHHWTREMMDRKGFAITSKCLASNNSPKQTPSLLLSHLQQHLIFAFLPRKMQLVQLSQVFQSSKLLGDSPYYSLASCEVTIIEKEKEKSCPTASIVSTNAKHVLTSLGGLSIILYMVSMCQGDDLVLGLEFLHSYLAHNPQGLFEMEQLNGHQTISRFILQRGVQVDEKLLSIILKMAGLEVESGKDASKVLAISDLKTLDYLLLDWHFISKLPPTLLLLLLDVLVNSLSSKQCPVEFVNFNFSLLLEVKAIHRFLQFLVKPVPEEAVQKIMQLVHLLVRHSRSGTELQEVAMFVMANHAYEGGVTSTNTAEMTQSEYRPLPFGVSMQMVKLLCEQLSLNLEHLNAVMQTLPLSILLGMLNTTELAHRMAIMNLLLLYLTDSATSEYFNGMQGCSIVALQLRNHPISSGLIKIFFDIMFGYGTFHNNTVPSTAPKIPMAASTILQLVASSEITYQEQISVLTVLEEVLEKHPKFLSRAVLVTSLLGLLDSTLKRSLSSPTRKMPDLEDASAKSTLHLSSSSLRGHTTSSQIDHYEDKVEECVFRLLNTVALECLYSGTLTADSVQDLLIEIYNAGLPLPIVGIIQRRVLWNVITFFKTNSFFGNSSWVEIFGNTITLTLVHLSLMKEHSIHTVPQSIPEYLDMLIGFSPSESDLLGELLCMLVNVYLKTEEGLKNEAKPSSTTFTPLLSQVFTVARSGISKVLLLTLASVDNSLLLHSLEQITRPMASPSTQPEVTSSVASRISAILPRALIGEPRPSPPKKIISDMLQYEDIPSSLSLRLLWSLHNAKATDKMLQQLIIQVWCLILSVPVNRKLRQYLPCPTDTPDNKFLDTIQSCKFPDEYLQEVTQAKELDDQELKQIIEAHPPTSNVKLALDEDLQSEKLRSSIDILARAAAESLLRNPQANFFGNENNDARPAHIAVSKCWSNVWKSVSHECGVFPWTLDSLHVLNVAPSLTSVLLRQRFRKKINIRIPRLLPPYLGETVVPRSDDNTTKTTGYPEPKLTDVLPCILEDCAWTFPTSKFLLAAKKLRYRSPPQENFGTYEIVLGYSGKADAIGTRAYSYIDCDTLQQYTNMKYLLKYHTLEVEVPKMNDICESVDCVHINPYSQHEGKLHIGRSLLHFQNLQRDTHCHWDYDKIEKIKPLSYQGKNSAIQIFLVNGNSFSFSFISSEQRDHIMNNMHPGIEEKEIYFCHLLQPLSAPEGELILTSHSANFCPKKREDYTIKIETIAEIHKCRHMLKHCALEFLLLDGTGLLFAFNNQECRERVHTLVKSLKPPSLVDYDPLPQLDFSIAAKEIVKSWQQGFITNFDYLMYVNTLAGRTFSDLNQYPKPI
ncbi:hypothetical protein Pelo_5325 [Pelomyxa schiedti]|nr:hypothetical protein Pelo_5325 [Pelomyxa schiedti]